MYVKFGRVDLAHHADYVVSRGEGGAAVVILHADDGSLFGCVVGYLAEALNHPRPVLLYEAAVGRPCVGWATDAEADHRRSDGDGGVDLTLGHLDGRAALLDLVTKEAATTPDIANGHAVPMAQTLDVGQVIGIHGHVEEVEVDGVQPKLLGEHHKLFHRDLVGVAAVSLSYRRVDQASELDHAPGPPSKSSSGTRGASVSEKSGIGYRFQPRDSFCHAK